VGGSPTLSLLPFLWTRVLLPPFARNLPTKVVREPAFLLIASATSSSAPFSTERRSVPELMSLSGSRPRAAQTPLVSLDTGTLSSTSSNPYFEA